MRIKKRPIIVEAVCVNCVLLAVDKAPAMLPPWVREAIRTAGLRRHADAGFWVETPEGEAWASRMHWIVQGVRGELYPILEVILRDTYRRVDGTDLGLCPRPSCLAP